MRKLLEKRLAAIAAQITDITARAEASNDAAEVRDLTGKLAALKSEEQEIRAALANLDSEPQTPPANATLVNAGAQSFTAPSAQRGGVNTESLEYREAFRAYVCHGTPIPAELRAELRAGNANSTADTGAAIPMTVMNEVINTVRKRYGNLYSKVKKTSVPGGVKIPIGSLQASFRWINESTVSPRQKVGPLGNVMFAANVGEIRIATTWLANILTLSAFEAKLSEIIAVAYLQAMDEAIVAGSGDGAPLGILNDARVTNNVTMTAAKMNNWKNWRTDFFAKLPLGYRAGEFIFASSTVESYLQTMSDDNNNPVFYQATGLVVEDGDAAEPRGRFFGREISLVEPDILPDFDTASAGDVIGIYWQPEEYMINENFGFAIRRYFDEETNEWVDKALTVVDGKVVNPAGIWLIKKGT